MKVVRTVFNGGHEETYGNATRLVPTQLIDVRMHIALQRPIAARRVRVEPTARVHRDVRGLLYGLYREIFGRVDNDRALATDPGDDGRPVFVIVASTRLTLLAATARAAPQRLLPALRRLPLVSRSMVEVIRFHGAFQLAIGFVGHGRIPQPPTPAIARPGMDPSLPSNPS